MADDEIIYLDNNATTQLDPAVVEEMMPFLTKYYGNPSSGYGFAAKARKAVDLAREGGSLGPRGLIRQRGDADDRDQSNDEIEGLVTRRRLLGRFYDSGLSSSSGFHSLLCHVGSSGCWASRCASRTIRRLSATSGES